LLTLQDFPFIRLQVQAYNPTMKTTASQQYWNQTPVSPIPVKQRLDHVRYCSPFVSALLDRYPDWGANLDDHLPPDPDRLKQDIQMHGLDSGLRRFRNFHMLRLIWRDLCDLASLDETFADLTALAEICLTGAIEGNSQRLQENFGVPANEDGQEQSLSVIGMGKFGGGELNLSSDIDIIFCFGAHGECVGDNKRRLSNDQFFIRLARAVIASLSDMTKDGFCFRVDTRLRPFGDSGPLVSSMAAMEQYYQREGRDWERYALIKARPVAGDLALGQDLMTCIRPFVYRRYIDFTAIEALQDMHGQVSEDARRTDRLDDIKRGPGGIREIEFLIQCFQLLRGGREHGLQTPSLLKALFEIEELGLLDTTTADQIRQDYVYLRQTENRIQAQRDQQTHRVPSGEDLQRLTQAMGWDDPRVLQSRLSQVRENVTQRFVSIFPAQSKAESDPHWVDAWRHLQADRQGIETDRENHDDQPLTVFMRATGKLPLSRRAHRRLDQFMPVLLQRLDRLTLNNQTLHRIYDLVKAICQRSAYLVLLVQNAPALDRLIDLFARSEWIAATVIRFPALLDELIDPSLGKQIPSDSDLRQSIQRLIDTAQGTEAVLEGLNYLKLATSLRIAVAQLEETLAGNEALFALADLADAVLQGVLELATQEIEARHGRIGPDSQDDAISRNSLAVVAYGSLGARQPGYDSDLDIVFLFDAGDGVSRGDRCLPAERYYARLAQRMLSFLTVMTPSGRLYPVDTRLRPNGRSGSLVSSLHVFRDYQLEQAWTWELQALTRARFVAGDQKTGQEFGEIRREALIRKRDPGVLRKELLEMREKMLKQHPPKKANKPSQKHRAGGLVDIEFVIQLGVLANAASHPIVIDSTVSNEQLDALTEAGWVEPAEAKELQETASNLRGLRTLETLIPGEQHPDMDCRRTAMIFQKLMTRD
jgi:glutamate-ammonia-ligase adenylyltransferase